MIFLKTILHSFYDMNIYSYVFKNREGYNLLYIFKLSLIIAVVTTIGFLIQIRSIDAEEISNKITETIFSNQNLTDEENLNRFINIFSQIPYFYIKNNELRGNFNSPHPIVDPLTKNNLAIIDADYEKYYIEDPTAFLVIAKDRFILQKGDNEPDIYKLRQITSGHFTSEEDLNFLINITSQVPEIYIENGKAYTTQNKPHTIFATKEYPAIYIDTTTPNPDLSKTDAAIKITQDYIFFKDPYKDQEIQFAIADMSKENIKEAVKNMAQKSQNFLTLATPILIIPTMLISSFAINAIMVFLYGFVAMLIAQMILKNKISHQKSVRISTLAITPATILNILLPSIFFAQGAIYFAITMAYIYFGLKHSLRQENATD